MSYRSLKRALGETSLERKCRFLFGACLLFLITASFWWYGQQTERLVYEQSQNTGKLLVNQALLSQHWESLETREREKEEEQWEWEVLVQELVSRLPKGDYEYRFIIPKTTFEENRPEGKTEEEIVRRFMATKPDEDGNYPDPDGPDGFAERIVANGQEYRYYQPVRATDSFCFQACHTLPPGGIGRDRPAGKTRVSEASDARAPTRWATSWRWRA